jgi:hypothetical protein
MIKADQVGLALVVRTTLLVGAVANANADKDIDNEFHE